jgi:putative tryptophan/tyrosine transport system substrate-binding protein
MRRREFLASLCGIPAAFSVHPSLAAAETGQKRPLIIWIQVFPALTGRDALNFPTYFLEGMAALGYVEGRDFVFEFRAGRGLSEASKFAEEVVTAQPTVIIAPATLEAVTISKATTSIPIVCGALADAVNLGLINSEARPGRNVTGVEPYIAGLPAKQIELAKELVPRASKVGLLTNEADPKGPPQTRELMSVLAKMGLNAVRANADQASDLRAAVERLAAERVDVVVVSQTNMLLGRRFAIAEAALEKHLPTVYGYRENVLAGGLASYGVDLRWCYRRAAYFVDRILKGTKPGDLPIEFPTSMWLAANVRAAESLDISLPTSLLARADEVIE